VPGSGYLNRRRNELDRAHTERTAPAVNANITASPTRLSSKAGLDPPHRAWPQKLSVRRIRWRPARWAIVASLLATAKLNGVEPFAYLKDVLERLSNGHPVNQLDDLLPWNWTRSALAEA
jgi:hypothetical protein